MYLHSSTFSCRILKLIAIAKRIHQVDRTVLAGSYCEIRSCISRDIERVILSVGRARWIGAIGAIGQHARSGYSSDVQHVGRRDQVGRCRGVPFPSGVDEG